MLIKYLICISRSNPTFLLNKNNKYDIFIIVGDIMIIDFDWFQQDGVRRVLSATYSIIDIIRYVVPIILIVMTSIEIVKKIINPTEKEGQKKILIRTIAAIIIFFIPTLINLVLRLADIEVPGINDNQTNETPQSNPPSKEDDKKENELTSLNIVNCPNALSFYHSGDVITLNSDIPDDYTKEILWSVNSGNKLINIIPTTNKKSAEIQFLDIQSKDIIEIQITAGNKKSTCNISVEPEKLDSLSFTNCPSTREFYSVGDTLTLNTDIKSSFKGNINWIIEEKSAASIQNINEKRSAKITVLDQPNTGYFFVKAIAGGKAGVCLINVSAVKELKITNCPDKGRVFHVGDTFILKNNLPKYYKRDISWESTQTPDAFKITPLDNGFSVKIEIISVPEGNYGFIGLGADLKGAACSVRIE